MATNFRNIWRETGYRLYASIPTDPRDFPVFIVQPLAQGKGRRSPSLSSWHRASLRGASKIFACCSCVGFGSN